LFHVANFPTRRSSLFFFFLLSVVCDFCMCYPLFFFRTGTLLDPDSFPPLVHPLHDVSFRGNSSQIILRAATQERGLAKFRAGSFFVNTSPSDWYSRSLDFAFLMIPVEPGKTLEEIVPLSRVFGHFLFFSDLQKIFGCKYLSPVDFW